MQTSRYALRSVFLTLFATLACTEDTFGLDPMQPGADTRTDTVPDADIPDAESIDTGSEVGAVPDTGAASVCAPQVPRPVDCDRLSAWGFDGERCVQPCLSACEDRDCGDLYASEWTCVVANPGGGGPGWQPGWRVAGSLASFADGDGDGDPDFAALLADEEAVVLYENEAGAPVRRSMAPAPDTAALAWLDDGPGEVWAPLLAARRRCGVSRPAEEVPDLLFRPRNINMWPSISVGSGSTTNQEVICTTAARALDAGWALVAQGGSYTRLLTIEPAPDGRAWPRIRWEASGGLRALDLREGGNEYQVAALLSQPGGEDVLYFVEGDGRSDLTERAAPTLDTQPPATLAWGMVNGEGVLAVADRSRVQVLRRVGEQLQSLAEFRTDEPCLSVAWADYDLDGDEDIACGGVGLRIYRAEGGQWTEAWRSVERFVARRVQWVDWDGDRDLDLAGSGDKTWLHLNQVVP